MAMFRSTCVSFLSVLVLFVAGCGDDSSSTPSTSSTDTSTTSTAPTAPAMSSMPMNTAPAADTTTTPAYSAPSTPTGDYSADNTTGYDPTTTGPYGAPGAVPGQPAKPKRPADANNWTLDDIASGIVDGDAATAKAIRRYAEDMEGKNQAVPQISAWLMALNETFKKPAAGQPDTGYPGYPSPDGYTPANDTTTDTTVTPEASLGRDRFTPYAASPSRFVNILGPALISWQDPTTDYTSPPSYDTTNPYSQYGQYGQNQQGSPGGGRDAIGRELVEALVANRTLEGYAAVRELLKGQLLPNISDDKLVAWIITGLMKHIDGPYSPAAKILRQTLLEPEVFRQQQQNARAADRYNAEELARQSLLLHVAFSRATVDGFLGIPEGKKTAAAAAPNSTYPGAYPGADATTPYPGAAPGYTTPGAPGQPQNPQPAQPAVPELPTVKIPNASLSPAEGLGATHYFWNPEMERYTLEQLQRVARFGQSPETFLMAGTIPSIEVRKSFRELLTNNWEQDPSWLVKQEVFKTHWRDPGLLVLLKTLPREQRPAAQNTGTDGSTAPGDPNAQRPARSRDRDTPAQKNAKYAWFDASEQYLLATMDRLAAAGQGERPTPYSADELGFRLHKGAEVTTSYRVEFPPPGDDSALFSHLEPTVVNYVRIESSQMDQQTAKHYETAVKGEEKRMILGNNGIWLDGTVRRDRIKGLLLSTDVLLSQSGARGLLTPGQAAAQPSTTTPYATTGQPGQAQGGVFVVEILTIVIPDPDAKPAEAATVTGKE